MLRINAVKTHRQKAMPLPISYPETDAEDGHREDKGVREINEKMRQETANEQKSLFPNMEFKGSGGIGMAVSLGDGKIGKYTDKRIEVNNALKVKVKNVPCVATVYDVQHIQAETGQRGQLEYDMWMIVMEEIEHLSPEDSNYISALRNMYEHGERNPGNSTLGAEYTELRKCLKANGIYTSEAHGWNVGRNKKRQLVLFDLG